MKDVISWFLGSTSSVVAWLSFIAAACLAIRNIYAAERDRRALSLVNLEREKLTLEMRRLQKDPEVIAERRQIYESVRAALQGITRDRSSDYRELIRALHAAHHDAEFRFDTQIVAAIKDLIHDVVDLEVASARIRHYHESEGEEGDLAAARAEYGEAIKRVLAFQSDMVELFREHISL